MNETKIREALTESMSVLHCPNGGTGHRCVLCDSDVDDNGKARRLVSDALATLSAPPPEAKQEPSAPETAWTEACALLRAEGHNPNNLIRRAAANIDALRVAPPPAPETARECAWLGLRCLTHHGNDSLLCSAAVDAKDAEHAKVKASHRRQEAELTELREQLEESEGARKIHVENVLRGEKELAALRARLDAEKARADAAEKEAREYREAFNAELAGNGHLRAKYGARDDETFEAFVARLAAAESQLAAERRRVEEAVEMLKRPKHPHNRAEAALAILSAPATEVRETADGGEAT